MPPHARPPVKWKLFYSGFEQNITVYPGTSRDDIMANLRQVLRLAADADVLLLDQDGDPVAVSAAIPSGTKLHVELRQTPEERAASRVQGASSASIAGQPAADESSRLTFTWDPATNTSSRTHPLSNGNCTISQPTNESCAGVLGSKVFVNGWHYWTLLFDPLQCCVYGGVVPVGGNPAALCQDFEPFWRLFEKIGHDPHGTFPGPTVEVGFLLDLTTTPRKLTVVDHATMRAVGGFSLPWAGGVQPAVHFKHEVSVTITGSALPLPAVGSISFVEGFAVSAIPLHSQDQSPPSKKRRS